MTAKIPTAQAVSAALRKAGFERSQKHTTRIRGYHNYTPGYAVRPGEPGEVSVSYVTGFANGADLDGRRQGELGKYAEALRARWNVQQFPITIPSLLVTEKADG